MAENNGNYKGAPKKGLPGSFFFFILMAILLVILVQSYMGPKAAKVSFSYELEHLVNLDLIEPQDSRKIALNDKLVTFSGVFRPTITTNGKDRYRFLELLSNQYQLQESLTAVDQSLTDLQKSVEDSSSYYLKITGKTLAKEGFIVVPSLFDTPSRPNEIVIKTVVPSSTNLKQLSFEVKQLTPSASKEQLKEVETALVQLVNAFRSPLLGIGNEAMKDKLQSLHELLATQDTLLAKNPVEQEVIYTQVITLLQSLTNELEAESEGVRLADLRSVRNYREELIEQQKLFTQKEDNEQLLDKARRSLNDVIWFFQNQQLSTRALEKQTGEAYGQWFSDAEQEWKNFDINKGLNFKAPDQPLNLVLEKTFKSEEPSPNYISYLLTLLPVIMIVFLLYFVFARQMKGMGGGAMSFGKAPTKMLTKGMTKVTFKDVAGVDEAKEELQEIVDFLKNPAKFTALGARIPKGVLCIGAPGTGKTLLAKAVAGEADCPFFSIAGSDFVEMFVGVGASRIRDLFEQAKQNSPCLIFMDEIDAVGRHRGAGMGGGHDEREQTLNQLLVEMDGFDTNEGVILMAATNRPDVLDKALLRPGRFDRRVVLDLPDIKGRFEILEVHAKKIKMAPQVDLMSIARATPGASGADLANILNEAALAAARKGKNVVTDIELTEACDKIRYGKERKSLEIDVGEKKTTAYHESGHAIVGLVVKKADPVDKVTIIPRGLSLGATHFLPKKNRLSYWKTELLDQLAIIMGGRCAEEIFVGDVSTGAQQDIEQATRLARSMVCEWGMTDELGLVAYERRSEQGQYLGQSQSEKSFSEQTAEQIDKLIREFISEAHKKAHQILSEHKAQVELMTEMLIEFETLDKEDVLKIINNEWSIEAKRQKIKDQIERYRESLEEHKQTTALPPPIPPAPEGV